MSKKYNEIMDKVVVTDEMRERLLARIADANPDTSKEQYKVNDDEYLADVFSGRRRKPETAKILAFLAAACVVMIAVGLAALTGIRTSETATVAMSENALTDDAAEREEAAAVKDAEDRGDVPEDAVHHAEDAGANTIVGAEGSSREDAADMTAGTGGATAEAAAQGGTPDATADRGATAEEATDAGKSAGEPIRLSEPEIRKIASGYIGESYKITDMAKDGNLLVYTAAYASSDKVYSYIRIDMNTGWVEIEDAHTGEIKEIYFNEMSAEWENQ